MPLKTTLGLQNNQQFCRLVKKKSIIISSKRRAREGESRAALMYWPNLRGNEETRKKTVTENGYSLAHNESQLFS